MKSWVNRRFGGTYRLNLQGRKIRERGTSVSRWLQTELQSVNPGSTQPHIPEDDILHSHRCENLKSQLPFIVCKSIINVTTVRNFAFELYWTSLNSTECLFK
jgi:hypothetical protein